MASWPSDLYTETVRKTTLEIDERKMARAAAALGTSTMRETVDRSLDEVIALAARERLIRRFSEPTDLADPDVEYLARRD
jgi:Arc/MetJ family transcription regulator